MGAAGRLGARWLYEHNRRFEVSFCAAERKGLGSLVVRKSARREDPSYSGREDPG